MSPCHHTSEGSQKIYMYMHHLLCIACVQCENRMYGAGMVLWCHGWSVRPPCAQLNQPRITCADVPSGWLAPSLRGCHVRTGDFVDALRTTGTRGQRAVTTRVRLLCPDCALCFRFAPQGAQRRARHRAGHGATGCSAAAEPMALRITGDCIGLGLVLTRTNAPQSCTDREGSQK